MNREQEILAIEDHVARESQYQKTLKLLHKYWNGQSAFAGEDGDYGYLTLLKNKDTKSYVTIWFEPKRGYIVKGKYRDTVVEQITGNPYLDMMTLYRAVERL